jgi:hypothetical protein
LFDRSIPFLSMPPFSNFFNFRVNTPNPFPESGSRKRFHA